MYIKNKKCCGSQDGDDEMERGGVRSAMCRLVSCLGLLLGGCSLTGSSLEEPASLLPQR